MTDPQVTQADRERARRLCPFRALRHAAFMGKEQMGCCADCRRIALELAKARQQGDEAVAAVVDSLHKHLCCLMGSLGSHHPAYPKFSEGLKWLEERHPEVQQILAERDKRVKEEACAQQRELRDILSILIEVCEDTWPEDNPILVRARRALGEKEATSEPGDETHMGKSPPPSQP